SAAGEETHHAEAGSLLAIRERATIVASGNKTALCVERPTVIGRRSRNRCLATAAGRLFEPDCGLDAGFGGIGRRLLSREMPGLYGSARCGASRASKRQNTGRLCGFHQQFGPLSA